MRLYFLNYEVLYKCKILDVFFVNKILWDWYCRYKIVIVWLIYYEKGNIVI